MDTSSKAEAKLTAIPKKFRRSKAMSRVDLETYRKRQLAAGRANRPKADSSWRGATKAQRQLLRRFGWSDSQIKTLTKSEVTYHIQGRNPPSVRFATKVLPEADKRIMEGKGIMATKPSVKKSGKKAATTKNPAKKAATTKKTDDKKATKKTDGVGRFVKDLIISGKTNEQVREAVAKKFGPDAKAATKPYHVSWYRSQLKRTGVYPAKTAKAA